MEPLFPPWTNSALWAALALGLIGIVALPVALIVWVRTPYAQQRLEPVEQPVQFDHRHHVRDDGIDCRYCHFQVEDGATAGMPPTELCMGCHAQIWNDSPLLEPVRRSLFRGEPIAWQRVSQLPDFAFFHHAVHVRRGVGCASCHGRVDLMAQVWAVAPLTMGWCLECHRDPAPHLRPADRITDMEWAPDPVLGRELQRQHGISPPTHCSACHR